VLQLRLSQHARTTKNMDLLALIAWDEVPQILTRAALFNLQEVDIILIAENMTINGPALRAAIQATFTAQGAGESPSSLPTPPSSWALTFRKLAEEVGLNCTTLEEADRAARSFLDPILGEQLRASGRQRDESGFDTRSHLRGIKRSAVQVYAR